MSPAGRTALFVVGIIALGILSIILTWWRRPRNRRPARRFDTWD